MSDHPSPAAFAAATARRQELASQWYAPAGHVWPEVALAPSVELFEEPTRAELSDGVWSIVPELYAPAWAVGALDGLVNRGGEDGWEVADFVEWSARAPERAAEVARAVHNVEHPDVGALRALYRRWLEAP